MNEFIEIVEQLFKSGDQLIAERTQGRYAWEFRQPHCQCGAMLLRPRSALKPNDLMYVAKCQNCGVEQKAFFWKRQA